MNILSESKRYLGHRQQAYQGVFDDKNVFLTDVMEDLAKFCRAEESTFNSDPRLHALLEGRREVYLRIMDHLQMDIESLFVKYGGKK